MALRGRRIGYEPNAPARVFAFRRKDLRRPSLARRAGMIDRRAVRLERS